MTIRFINDFSQNTHATNEPAHEILALFPFRKFILQMHMPSHPVALDVWFFVWPVVYFPSLCVRTVKALARLRGCAGSPEPSLVAYVVSTKIAWAGSNNTLNKIRICYLKFRYDCDKRKETDIILDCPISWVLTFHVYKYLKYCTGENISNSDVWIMVEPFN